MPKWEARSLAKGDCNAPASAEAGMRPPSQDAGANLLRRSAAGRVHLRWSRQGVPDVGAWTWLPAVRSRTRGRGRPPPLCWSGEWSPGSSGSYWNRGRLQGLGEEDGAPAYRDSGRKEL